jgi:hypothetical protein
MHPTDRTELRSTVEGLLALPFVAILCFLLLASCAPVDGATRADDGVYTGTSSRVTTWSFGNPTRQGGPASIELRSGAVRMWWNYCALPLTASASGYAIGTASCVVGSRVDTVEGGSIVTANGTAQMTLAGTTVDGERTGRFVVYFNGQK